MLINQIVTFASLPKNLEEFQALPQARLKDPGEVAALVVAALSLYPENPDMTIQMLDFLRGPRPLNGIDKQFLRDRFRGKEYLMRLTFWEQHRTIITHQLFRTRLWYQKIPLAEIS